MTELSMKGEYKIIWRNECLVIDSAGGLNQRTYLKF